MGRDRGAEMRRRFAVLAAAAARLMQSRPQRTLTACADPNNLPFSNRAGQGFENKLAQMIASDLHAKLDYVWWAQRRGYVRNTLNERKCDFWPGIGSNVEMVATTRPYYRSTYMFVTRDERGLEGPDPRRSATQEAQDRRADGRQRRDQHAARPRARAPRHHRQRPRLHALRRLLASPIRQPKSSRRSSAATSTWLSLGAASRLFRGPITSAASPRASHAVDGRHAMADAVRHFGRGAEWTTSKLLKEIDRSACPPLAARSASC